MKMDTGNSQERGYQGSLPAIVSGAKPEYPFDSGIKNILGAFDVDGTLRYDNNHNEGIVGSITVGALRNAKMKGLGVIPASGKARTALLAATGSIEDSEDRSFYVAYNGALVKYGPGIPNGAREGIIEDIRLSTDAVSDILSFAIRASDKKYVTNNGNITVQYYSDPHLHGEALEKIANKSRRSVVEDMQKSYLETNKGLEYQDAESLVAARAHKVMIISDNKKALQEIMERAQKTNVRFWKGHDISIRQTSDYFIEFQHKRATKEAGIAKIADSLGYDLKNSISFGDQPNDNGMLEQAGFGFAVANAAESTKEAADFVIPASNNQDGVGRTIDALFTNKPIEEIISGIKDPESVFEQIRTEFWDYHNQKGTNR